MDPTEDVSPSTSPPPQSRTDQTATEGERRAFEATIRSSTPFPPFDPLVQQAQGSGGGEGATYADVRGRRASTYLTPTAQTAGVRHRRDAFGGAESGGSSRRPEFLRRDVNLRPENQGGGSSEVSGESSALDRTLTNPYSSDLRRPSMAPEMPPLEPQGTQGTQQQRRPSQPLTVVEPGETDPGVIERGEGQPGVSPTPSDQRRPGTELNNLQRRLQLLGLSEGPVGYDLDPNKEHGELEGNHRVVLGSEDTFTAASHKNGELQIYNLGGYAGVGVNEGDINSSRNDGFITVEHNSKRGNVVFAKTGKEGLGNIEDNQGVAKIYETLGHHTIGNAGRLYLGRPAEPPPPSVLAQVRRIIGNTPVVGNTAFFKRLAGPAPAPATGEPKDPLSGFAKDPEQRLNWIRRSPGTVNVDNKGGATLHYNPKWSLGYIASGFNTELRRPRFTDAQTGNKTFTETGPDDFHNWTANAIGYNGVSGLAKTGGSVYAFAGTAGVFIANAKATADVVAPPPPAPTPTATTINNHYTTYLNQPPGTATTLSGRASEAPIIGARAAAPDDDLSRTMRAAGLDPETITSNSVGLRPTSGAGADAPDAVADVPDDVHLGR